MNSSKVDETNCSEAEPEKCCGQACVSEFNANIEILRRVPVFSGVPLKRLKLYALLCRRHRYRAGEILFRQGDRDPKGYIIVSGTVQIIRHYEDHSYILNELHEDDFFGGLALLAKVRRLFTVRAKTDVECLTLDRESFHKILLQFPEIIVKVLDVMIGRIVQMEEKFLQKHICEGHFDG